MHLYLGVIHKLQIFWIQNLELLHMRMIGWKSILFICHNTIFRAAMEGKTGKTEGLHVFCGILCDLQKSSVAALI